MPALRGTGGPTAARSDPSLGTVAIEVQSGRVAGDPGVDGAKMRPNGARLAGL